MGGKGRDPWKNKKTEEVNPKGKEKKKKKKKKSKLWPGKGGKETNERVLPVQETSITNLWKSSDNL